MSQQFSTSEFRIHVKLDPEDGQGLEYESLAAQRLGPREFLITASPMFAFDISAGDTVLAQKITDPTDGSTVFEFASIEKRGGHSTYRIYLEDDANARRAFHDADIQAAWLPIAALGATYERANDSFFAVDIPPTSNIAAIYDLLEQGETDGLWEFEEAHYEPAS